MAVRIGAVRMVSVVTAQIVCIRYARRGVKPMTGNAITLCVSRIMIEGMAA